MKEGFKFITSWDDGHIRDIQLANMLQMYNIPAIFFIPNTCELRNEHIIDLSKDFELGGHTVMHHDNLQALDYEMITYEVYENKAWLEEITGKKVDWFCYPKGRYDSRILKAVKESGFKYARTTKVGSIEHPKDNFQIETSAHIFPREEYNRKYWVDYAKEKFYQAQKNNGYFHLWGHSHEINRLRLWDGLHELFKYIYNKRKYE